MTYLYIYLSIYLCTWNMASVLQDNICQSLSECENPLAWTFYISIYPSIYLSIYVPGIWQLFSKITSTSLSPTVTGSISMTYLYIYLSLYLCTWNMASVLQDNICQSLSECENPLAWTFYISIYPSIYLSIYIPGIWQLFSRITSTSLSPTVTGSMGRIISSTQVT